MVTGEEWRRGEEHRPQRGTRTRAPGILGRGATRLGGGAVPQTRAPARRVRMRTGITGVLLHCSLRGTTSRPGGDTSTQHGGSPKSTCDSPGALTHHAGTSHRPLQPPSAENAAVTEQRASTQKANAYGGGTGRR